MNICHAYGTPPSEDEAGRLLNRALDLGVTFLDTAAIYGLGQSERLIQRHVMHRKAEFTLASKCVMDAPDGKTRVLDGSPAAITATLDRALQRLGTDHIDLYYLHRPDRNVPIEESVGALEGRGAGGQDRCDRAQRNGRRPDPPRARGPPDRRGAERIFADGAQPGSRGARHVPRARHRLRRLLAGRARDARARRARRPVRASATSATRCRVSPARISRTISAVVAKFEALALEAGCTPAQLALAWVLAQGDDIVPDPRHAQHRASGRGRRGGDDHRRAGGAGRGREPSSPARSAARATPHSRRRRSIPNCCPTKSSPSPRRAAARGGGSLRR